MNVPFLIDVEVQSLLERFFKNGLLNDEFRMFFKSSYFKSGICKLACIEKSL